MTGAEIPPIYHSCGSHVHSPALMILLLHGVNVSTLLSFTASFAENFFKTECFFVLLFFSIYVHATNFFPLVTQSKKGRGAFKLNNYSINSTLATDGRHR